MIVPPLLSVVATLTLLPGAGPPQTAPVEADSATVARFEAADVFELEWASDPRVSPDGSRIVYVRQSADVMTDRMRGQIWILRADGGGHRPLITGPASYSTPRWSPDGSRLLFVAADENDRPQLFVRWLDDGSTAKITQLERPPAGLSWSPDGQWIAFTMFVPDPSDPLVDMPSPPEGAEWAPRPRVIDQLVYRVDGRGLVEPGHDHLFVVPAIGGTARQLTDGPYPHSGPPAWSRDGEYLLVSGNRTPDWEYRWRDTEIYEVALSDGSIRALTDRRGPDQTPRVSPDGRLVAFTGYDDRRLSYQVTKLFVMNRDGTNVRLVTGDLDRDVRDIRWDESGGGLYFQYDEAGNTRVAHVTLSGRRTLVATDVGGQTIGRPYPAGAYTVSRTGLVAFTLSTPEHPADVAVTSRESETRRLTRLNEDLLARRQLAEVEEFWYESLDGRRIQGWIATPPGFDSSRTYPMILEIHGGPWANYGDRFSAEVQLYAAAGHVVVYTNPRGSTSYGEDFGNLIHHAYPGDDYHDLMGAVDAVLDRGYVDDERLFVTGGSGGGVLTAWIVAHTDRFAAAVVQKPVVNWYAWSLTADIGARVIEYWFPAMPWEDPEHYRERSPLQHVGKVATPTMLLVGEEDLRTPMAEAEQFYQALKLRRVPTALVRIPGAAHGIARRPSHLVAKVLHVLAWFERHGPE